MKKEYIFIKPWEHFTKGSIITNSKCVIKKDNQETTYPITNEFIEYLLTKQFIQRKGDASKNSAPKPTTNTKDIAEVPKDA